MPRAKKSKGASSELVPGKQFFNDGKTHLVVAYPWGPKFDEVCAARAYQQRYGKGVVDGQVVIHWKPLATNDYTMEVKHDLMKWSSGEQEPLFCDIGAAGEKYAQNYRSKFERALVQSYDGNARLAARQRELADLVARNNQNGYLKRMPMSIAQFLRDVPHISPSHETTQNVILHRTIGAINLYFSQRKRDWDPFLEKKLCPTLVQFWEGFHISNGREDVNVFTLPWILQQLYLCTSVAEFTTSNRTDSQEVEDWPEEIRKRFESHVVGQFKWWIERYKTIKDWEQWASAGDFKQHKDLLVFEADGHRCGLLQLGKKNPKALVHEAYFQQKAACYQLLGNGKLAHIWVKSTSREGVETYVLMSSQWANQPALDDLYKALLVRDPNHWRMETRYRPAMLMRGSYQYWNVPPSPWTAREIVELTQKHLKHSGAPIRVDTRRETGGEKRNKIRNPRPVSGVSAVAPPKTQPLSGGEAALVREVDDLVKEIVGVTSSGSPDTASVMQTAEEVLAVAIDALTKDPDINAPAIGVKRTASVKTPVAKVKPKLVGTLASGELVYAKRPHSINWIQENLGTACTYLSALDLWEDDATNFVGYADFESVVPGSNGHKCYLGGSDPEWQRVTGITLTLKKRGDGTVVLLHAFGGHPECDRSLQKRQK